MVGRPTGAFLAGLAGGISAAKGRDKRPQFDRMLRDAVRGKFDILAAWAVDRLGRSPQDLVATLGEIRAAGLDLFHQQAVDTTTPSGRAIVPNAERLRRVRTRDDPGADQGRVDPGEVGGEDVGETEGFRRRARHR
jgi:Resolvase, N terminal domain